MMVQRKADADADLVERCRKGDDSAMQLLYHKHNQRLFALALRLSGSHSDAEDVVQDAFLKAWRGIGKFRQDASFGTWIYRIALNLCRDLAKKRRPQNPEKEIAVNGRSADGIARRRLQSALAKLSCGYREVLVLHDVMEFRHPEIAQILGVDVGTSKSQLHKARAKMRKLLHPPNGLVAV